MPTTHIIDELLVCSVTSIWRVDLTQVVVEISSNEALYSWGSARTYVLFTYHKILPLWLIEQLNVAFSPKNATTDTGGRSSSVNQMTMQRKASPHIYNMAQQSQDLAINTWKLTSWRLTCWHWRLKSKVNREYVTICDINWITGYHLHVARER